MNSYQLERPAVSPPATQPMGVLCSGMGSTADCVRPANAAITTAPPVAAAHNSCPSESLPWSPRLASVRPPPPRPQVSASQKTENILSVKNPLSAQDSEDTHSISSGQCSILRGHRNVDQEVGDSQAQLLKEVAGRKATRFSRPAAHTPTLKELLGVFRDQPLTLLR